MNSSAFAPVSADHGVRAKNDLQFWSFCCLFHDLVVHRQDLFPRSKSPPLAARNHSAKQVLVG